MYNAKNKEELYKILRKKAYVYEEGDITVISFKRSAGYPYPESHEIIRIEIGNMEITWKTYKGTYMKKFANYSQMSRFIRKAYRNSSALVTNPKSEVIDDTSRLFAYIAYDNTSRNAFKEIYERVDTGETWSDYENDCLKIIALYTPSSLREETIKKIKAGTNHRVLIKRLLEFWGFSTYPF